MPVLNCPCETDGNGVSRPIIDERFKPAMVGTHKTFQLMIFTEILLFPFVPFAYPPQVIFLFSSCLRLFSIGLTLISNSFHCRLVFRGWVCLICFYLYWCPLRCFPLSLVDGCCCCCCFWGWVVGRAVTVFPMESHNTLRSWPILCRQGVLPIVRHAMRVIVTRRDFI